MERGLMLLGALSIFQKRPTLPITADDLLALDREGARSYNNVTVRTMARARSQLWAALFSLLFLIVSFWKLNWSAHGLLAFVLGSAAITVLLDGLRMAFAARWVGYSQMREYRTNDLLSLVRAVENGDTRRPALSALPQERLTVAIAIACTVIGLPIVGWLLSSIGWTSLDQVMTNRYLPLLFVMLAVWRLARGLRGIRYAKGSNVGARDLCLESDDALDTYALFLALGLLMLPLGSVGALILPFLVVLPCLAWRCYRYWWLRQSLQLLGRRVRRINVSLTPAHPK
jgi:hypothetical protein